MKRFSTWLASNKEKYSALQLDLGRKIEEADAVYNRSMVKQPDPTAQGGYKMVPLKQARGAARLDAKATVKNLGDLLQEAIVRYWAEVAAPVYANLGSLAAQRAMSIEWDKLLHAPGGLKSIQGYIAQLDEFAKKFSLKKGNVELWEEYALQNPAAADDAFIPEIGKGFSDSYNKPEVDWLPYAGEIQVEAKSIKDFTQGAPGSAWIGLLVLGQRTGGGPHLLYLIPALHMEKHLSLPHAPGADPVEQWGASGHHESITRCIQEGRIDTSKWHKTEYNLDGKVKLGDASAMGCVMGFAMVKAYNAIGHQWAFTSGTLNPTGTGKWEADAKGIFRMTIPGDQWCIPKSWAVAIWKSTKDFAGNINLSRGDFVNKKAAQAPPPPPKPPAKPLAAVKVKTAP
jgi:hypothetical protein